VYEEQIDALHETLQTPLKDVQLEAASGLDIVPCVLPNSAGVPRDVGIGALFYLCHAEVMAFRPSFDGYLLLHDGRGSSQYTSPSSCLEFFRKLPVLDASSQCVVI
jgi:hypothetical protein